jgi:hypothetical protein
MKFLFQTGSYGAIECEEYSSHGSIASGEAYFLKDDYVATIDKDGIFEDWWGRKFRVLFPLRGHSVAHATLEVMEFRSLATANPIL